MKTFFSIKNKLLVFSLCISLIPIAAITVIYYYNSRNAVMQRIFKDFLAIAESRKLNVRTFLETIKGRTGNFSSDGFIRNSLEKITGGSDSAGETVHSLNNHLLVNKKPLDRFLRAIFITDMQGRVVSSTDEKLIGADMSDRDEFKHGIHCGYGMACVGKPCYSPYLSANSLFVSSPVFDISGAKTIGILVNAYDLACLDEVTASRAGMGETGEVYLVNKDKFMITGSRFVEHAPLKLVVDTKPIKAFLEENKEIVGIYRDYKDAFVVGVSMIIPEYDWALIAEVDKSEAFAPLKTLYIIALILGGVSAVTAIGVGITFAVSASRPIRDLTHAAERIAGGDLNHRVKVVHKDEIGALATSFNVMAEKLARKISEHVSLEKTLRENKKQLQAILDNTTSVVYLKDTSFRYAFINRQFEKIFRLTHDRIIGRTDYEIFPREDADKFRSNDRRVLEAKTPLEFDEVAPHADGPHTYISVKFPLFNSGGVVYGICGISTDITERKRMENMLWKTNQSMRSMVQTSPLAIVVRDVQGRIKVWNPAAERIFGWKENEVTGRTMPSVPEFPAEEWRSIIENELGEGTRNALELRRLKKNGSCLDISLWTSWIRNESGVVTDILCIYADITERKRVEEEIKKLSAVIAQSVNIVFITDIKGNIEYVNPMFEQVTGYTKEEAIGQPASILASGEMTAEEYQQMWEIILSGKTWRGVFKNKKKSGQHFWANGLISPICDREEKVTNFLSIQEDITEKMESEERFKYLAYFDALTGLLNRTSFIEVLNNWIYQARIFNYIGVFLLIDIDKFRHFNDTYGNMVGDNLLKRTADVLENLLSVIDTEYYKTQRKDQEIMESILGRLGSDEYAIFLPFRTDAAGMQTAEEIRKKVETCWFEDLQGHLTVSIGVALYPEHGVTIHDLFSKADAANHRAKELGQNRVRLYHPEDRVLEKMHSRVVWKERIAKTIEENRFAPWFQPILDLRDNVVHHYEALARMCGEEGEIILPSSFIDTAETFGLISALDRVIIGKTLEYQSELKKQGKSLFFSVNLSGKEIGEKSLLEFLRKKLLETGISPDHLIIEITETTAIMEFDKAIEFVNNLKEIGCRFSLDDFGVGFTSFRYLKEIHVDYIKIDGSFILNLQDNPHDRLFVRSIADIAKGMGIKTIAEFVENEETVNILRELGVDYAQGYFIGRPAPEVV